MWELIGLWSVWAVIVAFALAWKYRPTWFAWLPKSPVRQKGCFIDDLALVELYMDVEESFNISISDEEGQKIHTVGELYDCINEKVTQLANSRWTPEEVWEKLKSIIMEILEVQADRVFKEANLYDLLLPSSEVE